MNFFPLPQGHRSFGPGLVICGIVAKSPQYSPLERLALIIHSWRNRRGLPAQGIPQTLLLIDFRKLGGEQMPGTNQLPESLRAGLAGAHEGRAVLGIGFSKFVNSGRGPLDESRAAAEDRLEGREIAERRAGEGAVSLFQFPQERG